MSKLEFSRFRASIDLGFVFIGRLGGILITLIFIPQYNILLGSRDFGVFSLVLSLQSLFLIFDFGLATLIARDFAQSRGDSARTAVIIADWRRAELAVAVFSCVGVTGVAVIVGDAAIVLLAGGLIATQVALNIAQSGLGALQHYRLNNAVATGGALVRALVSIIVLRAYGGGLVVLLALQMGMAGVQLALVRWMLIERLPADARATRHRLIDGLALARLWRDVRLMAAWSLAGALVIQCDKLIVSGWFSVESAGRYFLATTYALTPIAVLGGPLQQYFFPKIVLAGGMPSPAADVLATRFVHLTVLAVAAPSVVLVVFADVWLQLWLHDASVVAAIAPLARILFVGAAVSALGYYPTARLLAAQRTGLLARLSIMLSALTLTGAILAAVYGSLRSIATIYAVYFVTASVALWFAVARHHAASTFRVIVLHDLVLLTVAIVVPVALATAELQALLSPIVAAFAAALVGGVWTCVVGSIVLLGYGDRRDRAAAYETE